MPGRSGVKRAARAVACALLLSVALPVMAAPALSDLAQQVRTERVQAYERMVLQLSARIENGEAQGKDLAELFRISLSDAQRTGTLAGELELVRRYLRIEGLRLGDRLRVEEHLDGLPPDARVPPLLLQPLVENAVYHGIEPLPGGGVIRIDGELRDGMIALTVTNPLPPPRPERDRRAGHHMAIDNIRERLQLHFGRRGRLVAGAADGRFSARVEFPQLGEAA